MNEKNIGQNLGLLRQQSGMTQAQFAEKLGVTTDHVSHVEIGSGSISLALLLDICKLLEVTPNDILAGEYTPESKDETEALQIKGLRDKVISFQNVNPEDMMLLDYIYQFMERRKRD